MKILFILVLHIGYAFSFDSVCNECQKTIQRFNEAAKNPAKMSAIKTTLSQICLGTKYSEECRIFVEKLDFLAGYFLTDPKKVCNKINMCSDSQIVGLNRVELLVARKFLNMIDEKKEKVCDECQYASDELLKDVNDLNQAKMHDFISKQLCAHFKEYQAICDSVLDKLLPTLFLEFNNMFSNSKQFCVDIKLCSARQVNLPRLTANDIKSKLMGPKYVQNLIKSFQAIKVYGPNNLDSSMGCMECKMFADIALDQLKTSSMTQMLSGVLQGVLCLFLPEDFGCNDFIQTYGSTVVYMTLMQFDSEGICEVMKMCANDTDSQFYKLAKAELINKKCENCEILSNFLTHEMAKPKAKTEIVYGLQQLTCKDAPKSLHNLIENFVGGLLPEAYDKFLYLLQNNAVCKTIKAC